MNYFYYFIQACLVVLIIYTIPKLWAMSFTLPSIPSIPKLPSLPQGTFEPYQQLLIFLFVAFFTITIVEKWLRHFFISFDSGKKKTDDGIKLKTKMGTFGTMLMKN